MTDMDIESTLAEVQAGMLATLEALQLARARIAVLETENELLRQAVALATKAEGERILGEFQKRWPAARRLS